MNLLNRSLAAYLYSFAYSLMIHFYFNPSILVPYVCYIYRCFPLHLLFIFVTGPSLHCLEGNSLECSIRLLSATHHTLFFDLHPSMPDGVHGPFFVICLNRSLEKTRYLDSRAFSVLFEDCRGRYIWSTS